jgi:hypothetical protein
MAKVVTNGTFVKVEVSPGQFKDMPRRFAVLAEHGDFLWVVSLNNLFTRETPLTLRKSAVVEVK